MSTYEKISAESADDVCIVRFLNNRVSDSQSVDQVSEELNRASEGGCRHLLLNLEGVEFLPSTTINQAILLDRKLKARGGKLKFCCPLPEITEVFRITRLESLFDIHPTEAAALASLNAPEEVVS